MGPTELLGLLLFALVCSIWLVVSQLRGCFQPRSDHPVRDVAFLFSGPVMALLFSLSKAAEGTMAFMAGGIDADYNLRYGLNDVFIYCGVGFSCFAIGTISLMLPKASIGPSTQSDKSAIAGSEGQDHTH
jgi:hypothetical protein